MYYLYSTTNETSLVNGNTINLWKAGIENLVSESVVAASVQNWYATYYLPSSVHVTSEPEEVVAAQTAEGLTYQEDCWLKEGYLLINFRIKTIDGGEYHLAYNAAGMNDEAALESGGANLESEESEEIKVAGDCNMWSVENFVKEKTDSAGEKFVFEDGDFLILDLDGTDGTTPGAAGDYGSGGTH